ncbi:hypothetical protein RRG08_063837 [Elysia crispata]|uniref:Uncharacterized protein n=1 Tax=Elysia crispata TaxID=231223 RepID=A0AAE0Y659_9GAST|nr:hypothetical protein RRG08_063837 [Elysia crispata]
MATTLAWERMLGRGGCADPMGSTGKRFHPPMELPAYCYHPTPPAAHPGAPHHHPHPHHPHHHPHHPHAAMGHASHAGPHPGGHPTQGMMDFYHSCKTLCLALYPLSDIPPCQPVLASSFVHHSASLTDSTPPPLLGLFRKVSALLAIVPHLLLHACPYPPRVEIGGRVRAPGPGSLKGFLNEALAPLPECQVAYHAVKSRLKRLSCPGLH